MKMIINQLLLIRICFFAVIAPSFAFCQTIILKGNVRDKNTLKCLSGVSVIINGHKGVITDKDGMFQLNVEEALLETYRIDFSYTGYKSQNIPYNKKIQYYNVLMEPSENKLLEVVVSIKGKTIVEKAIKKIPANAPNKPIIVTGIKRLYSIINDSDYYYKSDAAIQSYYDWPDRKLGVETRLIQNKDTLIQNPKSDYYNDPVKTRWVGGYYSNYDLVYNKAEFIDISKMGHYNYHYNGKVVFENFNTYRIDFESKETKQFVGTMYIDTLTYAFVGFDYNSYNIKRPFFAKILFESDFVTYQKIGDKWYLKHTHRNATHESKYKNKYVGDYVFVSLDTNNITRFNYKEIAQEKDENIKTTKKDNPYTFEKFEQLFKEGEKDENIINIPFPKIVMDSDSVNRKSTFLEKVYKYIKNDNVRLFYLLAKSPAIIQNTTISDSNISLYTFGIGTEFRIYKDIFFASDLHFNLGLGGLSNKQLGYYFFAECQFNKKARPFFLSPLIGYSKITYSKKSISATSTYNNWITGTKLSLEFTHKKRIFIAGCYNQSFNETINTLLPINQQHFSFSTGITIKL